MDLNPALLPLIFIVTLAAKVVGTLVGGGGFVTQPFLMLLGVPPQLALAHDVTTSGGMNVTSVHTFSKHGMIKYRELLWWIPGMLIGPLGGVEILQILPAETVKFVVSIYCLVACTWLLFATGKQRLNPIKSIWIRRILTLIAGFVIGAYIGFSGAGTAFLTGTILVLISDHDLKNMTAMRHAIHCLPSVVASISYIMMGWIDLTLGLTMLVACLSAGYIGSHLVIKLPEKTIKLIFCITGIAMSIAVLTT